MSWFTFLPAALTIALSIALGRIALPLHPVWSVKLLATVAAMTTLATAGTACFISVNYGASLWPGVAARLPEWALIGDDTPIPAALGLPATAITAAGMLAAARLTVRHGAEVRAAQRTGGTVLDTDDPIAVAVPGRNGGVLVSRGLLTTLTPAQLHVVFQHERSHLRHHHHRYLAAGALAAGVLPPLRHLNQRLRFCIERWADEDAAEATADRTLVAHTIAHVALARTTHAQPFPAFTDSAVLQRVQALLGEPPGKNTITGPITLAGTGLSTSALASSTLQLDHALFLALL